MKPETTTKVNLQTGPGKRLEIQWESPAGNIPVHCLEWEVEHEQDGPDGKIATVRIVLRALHVSTRVDAFPKPRCRRLDLSRVKEKLRWNEWGLTNKGPLDQVSSKTKRAHEDQTDYNKKPKTRTFLPMKTFCFRWPSCHAKTQSSDNKEPQHRRHWRGEYQERDDADKRAFLLCSFLLHT